MSDITTDVPSPVHEEKIPGYGTLTPYEQVAPKNSIHPETLTASLQVLQVPVADAPKVQEDDNPDRGIFEDAWQLITGWLARRPAEGSQNLHELAQNVAKDLNTAGEAGKVGGDAPK